VSTNCTTTTTRWLWVCFLHHLWPQCSLDRLLDTLQRRRRHERVPVPVDTASRAITLLSWHPRVGAWSDVLSVHQNGRRTQIAHVLRTRRILAVPLAPHSRDSGATTRRSEHVTGELDVPTSGIVDQLDL